MPTIKDCILLELALRKGSIAPEKLEQAKTAQKELEKFGISKPIGAILLEKSLAPKETVTEIAEEMASYSIRCPACGRPSPVSDSDRNGNLKCKHCQADVVHETDRISEEDLSPALKSGNRGRAEARAGKGKAEPRQAASSRSSPGKAPGKAAPAEGKQKAASGNWDTRRITSLPQDDLTPRSEVTKFRLDKLVGVSPVGKLYRTSDAGSPATLKVLDRVLCAEKVQFKKWIDFMQRVQDLPRSVSVKPIQLFKEGSVNYTTRPYLGGPESSLVARLNARDDELLSAAGAKECAAGLFRSLQQFHAAHFVHGNLKPGNVILTEDGACLTDPGYYFLFDGLPPEERALRLSDAARYSAPEVLQGSEPTTASDVFSAGRILADILNAIEKERASKPELAQVCAWLEPLVARFTARDPTERPPSAKEALKEIEGTTGATTTSRMAPVTKSTRKKRLPVAWVRGRFGVKALGHSMLALAVVMLAYQLSSWYTARRAFASPHRGDELTHWIVSSEIADMERRMQGGAWTRSEAQKSWDEILTLFTGTPWEERVRSAASTAVSRLADPAEQSFSAAVADARAALEKKDWIASLQALLRVESRIEGSAEAKELFGRAQKGLFEESRLILVPRAPQSKGQKPATWAPGPFLAGAGPARKPGSNDAAATGISLEEATKLAHSSGARLPTSAEWDRLATFAREKTPAWAAEWAAKIENAGSQRGSLFEWIAGGEEDELARSGYGYCRGGDRPGAPPSHPLRRKASVGHPDVGARFVRSIQ